MDARTPWPHPAHTEQGRHAAKQGWEGQGREHWAIEGQGWEGPGWPSYPPPKASAEPDIQRTPEEEAKARAEQNRRQRLQNQEKRHQAYADDAVAMTKDSAGYNVPFAHRLHRKSPKELRNAVQGMLNKWAMARLNPTFPLPSLYHKPLEQFVDMPEIAKTRQQVKALLTQYGMDGFRCIPNFQDPRNQSMDLELWPGGKRFRDYVGDALPDFPRAKVDSSEYIVWDLYLTDYNPDFWPQLFQSRARRAWLAVKGESMAASSDEGSGTSSGKGVHPGPAAPSMVAGSGTSESKGVHPGSADTGSEWLQWHGTSLYAGLTAVGGNYLAKSETNRGATAPSQDVSKFHFEAAVTGGVYSSADITKSQGYSVPHWLQTKQLVKILLLVP